MHRARDGEPSPKQRDFKVEDGETARRINMEKLLNMGSFARKVNKIRKKTTARSRGKPKQLAAAKILTGRNEHYGILLSLAQKMQELT